MKTSTPNPSGLPRNVLLKQILLYCGILASLLYGVMMIAIRYDGYSIADQVVSELSAIGAPTRPLWLRLGFVYQALMIAFGIGVWIMAGRKRSLRVVAALLLIAYGVAGFIWPFSSMHQREVLAAGGGTMSDTMHLILSGVTVPSNLLILGFGAAAFGKGFRIYSIATLVVLLAFGTLTGMGAPDVQANLPTPWLGIYERILIFAFLVWLVVLAVILLRSVKEKVPV